MSDSSEKSTDNSKPAVNSKNLDVSLDRSSENVDRCIENVDENRSEIVQAPIELRRFSRVRRPPERYGDCHYY